MTVFNRFNRWRHRNIWQRIVAVIELSLSSTITEEQKARLRFRPEMRKNVPPTIERVSDAAWKEALEQLENLARMHHGKPVAAWLQDVVEWHMDRMFEIAEQHSNIPIAFNVHTALTIIVGVLDQLYKLSPRRHPEVDKSLREIREYLRLVPNPLNQRTEAQSVRSSKIELRFLKSE
jgi:hypothetical protein